MFFVIGMFGTESYWNNRRLELFDSVFLRYWSMFLRVIGMQLLEC